MCKMPKPVPGTKLITKKALMRNIKMNCQNCTINIENTTLDFVECETCPIVLCARCDMYTKLMTLDEDCVIRCRLCYEIKSLDNTHLPVLEHPVPSLPDLVQHNGNEILYGSCSTLEVKEPPQ